MWFGAVTVRHVWQQQGVPRERERERGPAGPLAEAFGGSSAAAVELGGAFWPLVELDAQRLGREGGRAWAATSAVQRTGSDGKR